MKKMFLVGLLFSVVFGVFALDTNLIEQEILRLVNKQRVDNNLIQLQVDTQLQDSAREHSADMLANTKLSHVSKGKLPAERVRIASPKLFFGVFENIAYCKGENETEIAETLVNAWMNSDGHKKNILAADVNFTGIGVSAPSADNIYYVTQLMTDSVARLISDIPANAAADSDVTLKCEFLGSFDKNNLVVFATFPNADAKYMLEDGKSYYAGCGVLKPNWIDNKTFEVTIPCKYGTGEYKLYMGKNQQYYPDCVVFTVK
jgi:hypothetical protein